VTKKAGELWQELNEEEKNKYVKINLSKKKAYEKLKEKYDQHFKLPKLTNIKGYHVFFKSIYDTTKKTAQENKKYISNLWEIMEP